MRRLAAVAALIGATVLVLVSLPLLRRIIADFTLPLQYASIIRQQAHEKHLDPALVAAVIYSESRFDPRTSSTGALGLMQIEPETAKFLAHRSGGTGFTVGDLDKPSVNIAYGSYYLRYLLNLYSNDEVLALAAYNGGATNVNSWVSRAHRRGRRFTISDIPITQTRAYVQEVLAKQHAYRTNYAHQLGYS